MVARPPMAKRNDIVRGLYSAAASVQRLRAHCELGEADETDLALGATGRPPSRTPLSQSASALLDVKASNLAVKVNQDCAWRRLDLASSTWQQLGHLGFMLHACRAWLH